MDKTVLPIIAISTRPRVGSMWAFNVARSLATSLGFSVFPAVPPKLDAEMLAAANRYLAEQPAHTYCIVKFHGCVNHEPNVRVIYLERETRDRIFSLHRFEKRPLTYESVSEEVKGGMTMACHYADWPASNLLRIQFDSIESNSVETIRRIASFMSLTTLTDQILADVNAKYQKTAVKEKIAELDQVLSGAAERENVSRVAGSNGVMRAYDNVTGFQSGHVSGYRAGDWQRLWSDNEKAMVDRAIRAALEENS